MLGKKIDINDSRTFEQLSSSIDAQAFIISKNIHRRHLSADDKRDLIGKLLKASPEKSDRSIAKLAKTSPTTVGAVRSTVQSGQLDKRIGADGKARKQPARLKNTDPDCPDCGGNGYFRGGDSGRCHCHGSRPKTSTPPDNSSSGYPRYRPPLKNSPAGFLRARILLSSCPARLPRLVPLRSYQQERDEIMRGEAERFVEKLIKTDIESPARFTEFSTTATFVPLPLSFTTRLGENLMVKMTA